MAAVKIIGKVAVKVMPDTTEFKDRLKEDLEKIERQIGDLKVDVVPQITKASKEKVEAEMKALAEKLSGENVHFDLGLNEAEVASVESALDALARTRRATINVDVDKARMKTALDTLLMLGGARPQIDALRESVEKLRSLDYLAISVGTLATKVTLLGGAALAASGHVLVIAGNLAKIGNLGLVLPGLLGGIAIGFGTTFAALKDFAEYVPQASGYMSDLQDAISNNFWDQAADRINAFVDGVFPILLRNLSETGTELGKFFGAFADALGTKLNPGLDTMFAALNESIAIATKHADSFAQIIRVLGELGSSFLPNLATWFGNVSDKFAKFLTTNQDNGNLNKWVNEGIENLQALGSVVSNTVRIFYGLYTAARDAGGATLTSLADGLKGIADTVNSSGFQDGMTKVFKSSFDMMDAITNGAGPGLKKFFISLGDIFNQVGPSMGETIGKGLGALFDALSSPPVIDGVLAVFDGIQNAAKNMTPTIKPLVGMFASLGPVIGAMLTQISAIGAQGMDRLAPTIEGLAKAVVPVINKLGEFFTKVTGDLTPVFQKMGENLTNLVKKFPDLINAVQDLWNVLAPVLIPALKFVVEIIGGALMGVVTGIIMVFKGLTKIVTGVIDVLTGIWDVLAGLFTLDLSRVGEGFKEIFSGLGNIIMGALQAVGGAIWAWLNGSIFGFFRKFVGTLGTRLVGPMMDGFRTLASGIGSVFGTAFSVIGRIVGTGGEVLGTVFKTLVDSFVAIFRTGWSVVSEIFTTVFSVIGTVGRAVWNGLVDFFRTSMDGLYFLFKGPWDAISEFLLGLWTTIKATAMLLWDGLRGFFDDMLNRMIVRFEDAWNAIKGAAEAVWNAIKSFFTNWWNNLTNNVTNAANGIKNFLGNAWDAMKSKAGDIWDGIKSKISDVWNGIKSKVEDAVEGVKSKMSNVWNDVKSKVDETWESIKSKVSGTWEDVKSKVSGAVEDIKSKMSGAWEDIKTKLSTAWDDMVTKIGNKTDDAKTEVGKLPGKALDALAGIGGTLINAGQLLIQGLVDGITGYYYKVKDALTTLTSKFKDWKGPAPVDRVLLTPAGQMIIDGLIAGLESRYKDVRSSLQGLTEDIATQFDGTEIAVGVATNLDTTNSRLSAIGGLTAKVNASDFATPADTGSVQIDNITIPLEDLKQLKSLEDFLDMLRVRTRQGVIA